MWDVPDWLIVLELWGVAMVLMIALAIWREARGRGPRV